MATQAIECKWSLCFERWDRSTLFEAFRGYEKYREAIISTMWQVFDEDSETVNASVEVNNLDEVGEVMTLIKSHEKYGSGVVLHVTNKFDVGTISASLAQVKTGYEQASASMMLESQRERNAEAYRLVVQMEQALRTLHNLAMVRIKVGE